MAHTHEKWRQKMKNILHHSYKQQSLVVWETKIGIKRGLSKQSIKSKEVWKRRGKAIETREKKYKSVWLQHRKITLDVNNFTPFKRQIFLN